jgi:predicted permease
MLGDLRFALRVLGNDKGWTAIVVLSLALGIGANTAIFSALNGLLLKSIPVHEPDTLVRLRYAGRNDMVTSSSDYGYSDKDARGRDIRATFSYPMFLQLQAANQTLSEMLACAPAGQVNLVVDGHAEVASTFASTGNYYRMLGISARLGRTIMPDDDRPDAPPVAVVSSKYWQSRFGGNPNVVGKAVTMNGVPVTIIGVLPAEFTGVQRPLGEPQDVSIPLALDRQLTMELGGVRDHGKEPPRLDQPTYWWLQVMGRLKPGVAPEQVQANLEGVFQHTARAGLASYLASLPDEDRAFSRNRERRDVPSLTVDSGARGIYDPGTTELRAASILSAVVVLVLLLVCANVANLLLSRAAVRTREISVRLSIGATRWRLLRQLLTESLLLSSIGGAFGILIGYWGRRLLPGAEAARGQELDWRVLSFVAAVTVITGIVFGIAPALRATRLNVSAALKDSSRSVVASRSVLGKMLLVLQVAISLVLLIGAGLFLQTLRNLRSVDVGFNPQNLMLFRVSPGLLRYDEARYRDIYDRLISEVRSTPGVRGATLSNVMLLSGSVNSSDVHLQGATYTPGQRGNSMNRIVAGPEFFETIGIPLQAGRTFTNRDHQKAPKVVIVNEAAVRKFFAGQNPLGRRFGYSPETSGEMEIVGVVRDAKYSQVRGEAPPTMYVPHLQAAMPRAVVQVRTAGDPVSAVGAIREALRRVDPALPMQDVFTQMEQVERRMEQERLFARAYALFGALALVIAAIGLFGLMSYSVSRRTNEIGIRMALGARRGDVLGQVMRESAILVVAGVAVGLAAALGTGRFIAAQLYGLEPADVATNGIAIVLLMSVAGVAGFLPARRASRVDPMVALRCD